MTVSEDGYIPIPGEDVIPGNCKTPEPDKISGADDELVPFEPDEDDEQNRFWLKTIW